MDKLKIFNLSTYAKIGALLLLALLIKFTLLSSKPLNNNEANLELVISDFNSRPISNAKIYLYHTLNEYLNDKPAEIDNWECNGNHYIFEGLYPQSYYFRVVYASLDNSGDVYRTSDKLIPGITRTYSVVLK